LHDLEELNAQQAADICGCSLATAKIRIHRGRQRLRTALQGQCAFYRDERDVLYCDRK
jgi:RNA polymerase sigma-70 factor (ECF subfamily)